VQQRIYLLTYLDRTCSFWNPHWLYIFSRTRLAYCTWPKHLCYPLHVEGCRLHCITASNVAD